MGGNEEQRELIKNFVDISFRAKFLLSQKKIREAKQIYLELLDVYTEINNSSLVRYHKELAHQELISLHSAIGDAKEPFKLPIVSINMIIAFALIAVFGLFLFMNPKFIGFASFSDTLSFELDKTFKESEVFELVLLERPLSLSVSGRVIGDAKLYLKQGEQLRLIFDSEKVDSGSFFQVCEDSCKISADSNVVELFAAVSVGSELFLETLHYKVLREKNSPPVWVGNTKEFTLTDGFGEINLYDYFSDPDGDDIVFLATKDDGLEVVVNGDILSVRSGKGVVGKKKITLIASDLKDVTKVPVIIDVM